MEQENNPYAPNAHITCHIHKDIFEESKKGTQKFEYEDYFAENSTPSAEPCTILKRYSQKGKSGEYLYQVSMVDFEDKTFVVNDFPRDAIEFFNAPYTSDQNLENAFRHEIHLPDGMFPAAWLDLKER